MKTRTIILMTARMVCVYLLGWALIYNMPGWCLKPVATLAGALADATCPYFSSIKVATENIMIRIQGEIHVDMELVSGAALPHAPATWHKHGGQTLNMLMMAMAIWAVPVVTWQRRLLVFPFMLLAAVLFAAFDLAIEMQVSALKVIGTQWLPEMEMANTAENIAVFEKMETWYKSVQWIKAFQDAGGRFFLAVLAGLIGYTIPRWFPGRKLVRTSS
jgi:hypothetical protein